MSSAKIKYIIGIVVVILLLISGCISNKGKENTTTTTNGGTKEEIIDDGTVTNTDEDIIGDTTEDTIVEEDTPVDNARIESEESYAIQLDNDSDPDALKVTLYRYNTDGSANKSEGTLQAILFENIEDNEEGPVKGKELDRWTVQVKESDYGPNDELVETLEYHKEKYNSSISSPSGFGWIDYTFTTKDGQEFQTSDTYARLVIE